MTGMHAYQLGTSEPTEHFTENWGNACNITVGNLHRNLSRLKITPWPIWRDRVRWQFQPGSDYYPEFFSASQKPGYFILQVNTTSLPSWPLVSTQSVFKWLFCIKHVGRLYKQDNGPLYLMGMTRCKFITFPFSQQYGCMITCSTITRKTLYSFTQPFPVFLRELCVP